MHFAQGIGDVSEGHRPNTTVPQHLRSQQMWLSHRPSVPVTLKSRHELVEWRCSYSSWQLQIILYTSQHVWRISSISDKEARVEQFHIRAWQLSVSNRSECVSQTLAGGHIYQKTLRSAKNKAVCCVSSFCNHLASEKLGRRCIGERVWRRLRRRQTLPSIPRCPLFPSGLSVEKKEEVND